MEYVCAEIEQLISCYTCDAQSLPPLQLCKASHVNCGPCAQYMSQCACGDQFDDGPHVLLDWLMSALKFRCKYQANDAVGAEPSSAPADGGDGGCPENRWYNVHQLRQHYQFECPRNVFPCPWISCDHVGRIETAVDHYETAHGPFEVLTPTDLDQVTFTVPSSIPAVCVKKIFNGYFLIAVKHPPSSHRRRNRDSNPPIAVQNINPADPLRYTCYYRSDSPRKDITIIVSIIEALNNS